MINDKSISKILKAWIENYEKSTGKRFKQRDFANKINIAESHLSKIILGIVISTRSDTMRKIASGFGVSLTDFYALNFDKTETSGTKEVSISSLFHAWVKKHEKQTGKRFSQKDFAKKIGVTENHISRISNNAAKNIRASTIEKIASGFGVSVPDFYGMNFDGAPFSQKGILSATSDIDDDVGGDSGKRSFASGSFENDDYVRFRLSQIIHKLSGNNLHRLLGMAEALEEDTRTDK